MTRKIDTKGMRIEWYTSGRIAGSFGLLDAEGHLIAQARGYDESTIACILAAAPDLYDACVTALEALQNREGAEEAVRTLRAALEKAERVR